MNLVLRLVISSIVNFVEKILPASLDNSVADIKTIFSQKFDGIKNTGNSVISNFYDVFSYVNINTDMASCTKAEFAKADLLVENLASEAFWINSSMYPSK